MKREREKIIKNTLEGDQTSRLLCFEHIKFSALQTKILPTKILVLLAFYFIFNLLLLALTLVGKAFSGFLAFSCFLAFNLFSGFFLL